MLASLVRDEDSDMVDTEQNATVWTGILKEENMLTSLFPGNTLTLTKSSLCKWHILIINVCIEKVNNYGKNTMVQQTM